MYKFWYIEQKYSSVWIVIFDFTFTVVIDYYLMQSKQFFTYLGENKLQFDEKMSVLY